MPVATLTETITAPEHTLGKLTLSGDHSVKKAQSEQPRKTSRPIQLRREYFTFPLSMPTVSDRA